jgi:Asp-tRNA(Asn)/Glu-tRNA(Gln) amidotransferase A subunit family amidase
MGRDVADTALLFSAQAAFDPCDPLSYPVDPAALAVPPACDLSALRVAYTEDFGVCPVDEAIRAVFRERIDAMRPMFARCDAVTPDFREADACFDAIRAANYVARYREAYDKDPYSLGPNVRANYELGAKLSLADMAAAHTDQTRLFRRFQQTFRDYDVVLCPTTPVTPFPWTQLYLAELNGQKLRNYYHWLALTYVVTLATNPAVSIPCGTDHRGMPFGLQVVGRFRGDRELLGIAHALEQAFARHPGLARPKPDCARLRQPTPELKSIITHPPALPRRA